MKASDCKEDYKTCKKDKTTCLKHKKKKRKSANYVAVVLILSCIITALLTIVFYDKMPEYISTSIFAFCTSVIAAALCSLLIDFSSRFKEYRQYIIDAITDDSYLTKLDEDRLSQLRRAVTKELHAKDVLHIPEGLLVLDQEICDLISRPYYKEYSQIINCHSSIDDEDTIRKDMIIDYELINPKGKTNRFTETISLRNCRHVNDDKKTIAPKVTELWCKIDGKEKKELLSSVDYIKKQNEGYYNEEIILTDKNKNNTDNPEAFGIDVEFQEKLEVHMRFENHILKDDIIFTKRLRRAAEKFELQYTYNGDLGKSVKLVGQVLGSQLKQTDINITSISDNSIVIRSSKWLLPENGAVIAACKI